MLTVAIFKNGGCECWISQIITYLKMEYPEIYKVKCKINIICKTVPEIRKRRFFILSIAKNAGSIQMSDYSHTHSEIVRCRGYLCQISCFCSARTIYGVW